MAALDSTYPSVPAITINSYNRVGINMISPSTMLHIKPNGPDDGDGYPIPYKNDCHIKNHKKRFSDKI